MPDVRAFPQVGSRGTRHWREWPGWALGIAMAIAIAGPWTLAGCADSPNPSAVLATEVPSLPAVSAPLPVSAQAYPFLASDHDTTPINLPAAGYEEREYVVSGSARVFAWPTLTTLSPTNSGRYVTRIVVRRPADPGRFSGRVRVEPLNPTSGHDLDSMWEIGHAGFMRSGDAYVGITVTPETIAALKHFDPIRYAPLEMRALQPNGAGCRGGGRSDPAGERGLAWDVISQVGALVRSESPANPLRDLHPRTSTLTGWSQSASYDLTYLNAVARHVTLPGGGPIFESYLPGAGGYGGTSISRCTPLPPPGDPRVRFNPPPGVALAAVSTPTDFGSAASFPRATDRPDDSDTPERRVRLYEIGGGSHLPADQGAYFPNDAELPRAGFRPENRVAYQLSSFPLHDVLDAAFSNLDAWVQHNLPPPHATRLTVANPGAWPPQAATDPFDNPVGGVRTTVVDVPTATFVPRGLKAPGSDEAAYAGHDVPFSPQYLRVLYPTHDDYVAKVTAAARALQSQRWLTVADADERISDAQKAPLP